MASFNSDINLLLQSMPKICKKTILFMCLISSCRVLHRLRDHVWYVFCSAQWRIWRDSIPISIWYCNLCQKSAIRQYYSFVWSRPTLFHTDLEVIFEFWYESYIERFDEFQFRYQFVTAIYAKNLQEDNITRVFDLALFYTRCGRVVTDFLPYPKFRKSLPSW